MTKGIQFSVAAVAMLFAFGGQLQAGVVTATFLSVADNSQFGVAYVDNVSAGDTFKIVVTMDNGGSSLVNQYWGQSDVQNVTFDFNNGAHKTVFGPTFNYFDVGGFVTDGAGLLSSIPMFWNNAPTVISTNSSQSPSSFWVSGGNDPYYTGSGVNLASVGLPDPFQLLVASNWTIAPISPGAAVPEPSTIAVFGMGLCAFVVNVARRRRNAKQQGALV